MLLGDGILRDTERVTMLTRNKASGNMVADLGKDLWVLFDHLLKALAIGLVNRFIVLPE